MPKQRLDLLLVERDLAESRAKAQALVMAGQVRVDGQVELKGSAAIAPEARLELEMGPRFVKKRMRSECRMAGDQHGRCVSRKRKSSAECSRICLHLLQGTS
jgi:ribosomal 50S subunit-recycling heat shock protein